MISFLILGGGYLIANTIEVAIVAATVTTCVALSND